MTIFLPQPYLKQLPRRRFLQMTCLGGMTLFGGISSAYALAKDAIPRSSIQHHIDGLTIYLNRIRTLKAEIEQTNPNGSKITGSLTMKRPGLMHLAYDPPSQVTVIANARSLIVVDAALEEASYIPLGETPANFFLQRVIDLSPDKVAFLKFQSDGDNMFFDVTSAEVENVGVLRIIFRRRPLSILGWSIIEPDNRQTVIFLKKLQINVAVDDSLFAFANPWI